MSRIAIITDSLASMPHKITKKYDIKVAPLVLIWDGETLLDNVDISPSDFYTRLKTAKVMPTSSQVTIETFRQMFKPFVDEGTPILVIVASHKLSMTINSAEQAKAMFPGATIEIIDSFGCAMSLGLQVLAAARAAQDGKSFDEVVAIAHKARENTGMLFVVDTLEFLHRGGRIGGAARLLGTALNLKPLLELQEGQIEPIERVRTKTKAKNRMLDIIEERLDGKTSIRLAVLNAGTPDEAHALLDRAIERFDPVEAIYSEISPVVGCHTGPGTIGLAYCTDL